MNILGTDHLEFYVGDARQAAYYLCTAFGFRIRGQGGPETGLTDQYSLLLTHGDIRIVLTSGLRPEHPAAQYVARHGDGIAIIAFATLCSPNSGRLSTLICSPLKNNWSPTRAENPFVAP